MARTTTTECATCGDEIEVSFGADDGADEWSVQQRDDYCGFRCREEGF
jgi:hypothetical protein